MMTIEEVQVKLRSAVGGENHAKKGKNGAVVQALSTTLNHGEDIGAVMNAIAPFPMNDGVMGVGSSGGWYVATDSRILYLDARNPNKVSGITVMNYKDVDGIRYEKHLVNSWRLLMFSGRQYSCALGEVKHVERFCSYANQHLVSANNRTTSTSTAGIAASAISELERLARLRADGMLTDIEFTAAKRRLLGL